MLYENEELRLRTININAEVEKGTWYRYAVPLVIKLYFNKNQKVYSDLLTPL